MRIAGDAILEAALEAVTGERATGPGATADLDVIARRSLHVIDSANLSPSMLGERAQAYCVVTPANTDRFTWGPGGDVFDPTVDDVDQRNQLLPPSAVRYWTYQDGDYERKMTPNGRLSSLDEWLNHDWIGTGGWPRLLYWQRNLDANQRAVFLFAPSEGGYTLNLYAQVPALDRVERGEEYDLPQGVAAYLIALLAIDACQPFRTPPRPEMFTALKMAERGLQRVPAPPQARVSSPDWLDLDGRGSRVFYGFGGR